MNDNYINALSFLDNGIENIIKINYTTKKFENIKNNINDIEEFLKIYNIKFKDIESNLKVNDEFSCIRVGKLFRFIKINKYYLYLYVLNTTSDLIKSNADLKKFIKEFNNKKIGIMYFHVLKNEKLFIKIISDFNYGQIYKANSMDYYIICNNLSKEDFKKCFDKLMKKITKMELIVGSSNIWKNNCNNLEELLKETKRGK